MSEYEYRPLKRIVGAEEWTHLETGYAPYVSVTAVRGIITREEKLEAHHRASATNALTRPHIIADPALFAEFEERSQRRYEYKIQKRVVNEWEDDADL